ncbi:Uncharacterised protein [Mycobacteroides abscessus]|nr:Uncharacterised protein [Mycobacteroides abscessus]
MRSSNGACWGLLLAPPHPRGHGHGLVTRARRNAARPGRIPTIARWLTVMDPMSCPITRTPRGVRARRRSPRPLGLWSRTPRRDSWAPWCASNTGGWTWRTGMAVCAGFRWAPAISSTVSRSFSKNRCGTHPPRRPGARRDRLRYTDSRRARRWPAGSMWKAVTTPSSSNRCGATTCVLKASWWSTWAESTTWRPLSRSFSPARADGSGCWSIIW